MNERVGEHNAVEKIVPLPLLLLAEIGVVDAGRDGGVRGDERKRGRKAVFGDLEADEPLAELLSVRSADADERYVERDYHHHDAYRDKEFDLAVNVLCKICGHNDHYHYRRAYLQVDAEDKVHARAGAGDVAHREEQAGEEQRNAHYARADLAEILADRVDGGHAGGDRKPVGGHNEGDAHEDDGQYQPDQCVAVVRAEHRSRGNCAGANNYAGCDEAGADAF